MPAPHVIRHIICSQRAAVVAPATFTTWDPANKGTDLVLSNGNLTVTFGAGSGFENVRALASASSGKKYFEWHADFPQIYGSPGICNSSQTMNGDFLGGTASGICYLSSGYVYVGGVNTGAIQTFAQGDTVCVALDIDNQKIWFRTNGGNWNNNGSADPATNAGGIDSSAVSGPYFPAGGTGNQDDAFTANFGATAYAQAAPQVLVIGNGYAARSPKRKRPTLAEVERLRRLV